MHLALWRYPNGSRNCSLSSTSILKYADSGLTAMKWPSLIISQFSRPCKQSLYSNHSLNYLFQTHHLLPRQPWLPQYSLNLSGNVNFILSFQACLSLLCSLLWLITPLLPRYSNSKLIVSFRLHIKFWPNFLSSPQLCKALNRKKMSSCFYISRT